MNKEFSKGFTLIEMIVVMAIFLVVVGAALNIFISIIKSENKLLAQQQALSQVAYIEQYMGNAIRAAVEDTSGSCLGASRAGNFYYPSDVVSNPLGNGGFYDSIEFLNGSDVEKGGPVCDEFYLDTTTNVLKEIKGYKDSNYNMDPSSAVAVSSSSFDISSIRFAIDGLNQIVAFGNNKPIFLADSNKTYLGNVLAFTDGTQLARTSNPSPSPTSTFTPTPSPIESPTPTPVLGCTNPNATNYNPLATQDDGSCILQSCATDADCDFGFTCNPNGFCTNPSNVAPPTKVDGHCGFSATTYLYTDTSYGVTPIFCSSGIVDPSNPSFPTPGSSVTWMCDGTNGGNPSGTCTAYRASAPTTISTKESFVTFVITFKIPGINQVITIESSVTRPI